MKTKRTKKPIADKYVHAMQNIVAQILLNEYTAENVIFGNIGAGDEIPFERYVDDLGMSVAINRLDTDKMDGSFIANGVVKEYALDELFLDVFTSKLDNIFGITQDGDPIYDGFTDDMYKLFREIMAVEVEYDPFAPRSPERVGVYFDLTGRLVAAIGTGELRPGRSAERYIKDLPSLSPFVDKLLRLKNNRRVPTEVDTRGIDYKLAVLSCFKFYGGDNCRLFETKMTEWCRLNIG